MATVAARGPRLAAKNYGEKLGPHMLFSIPVAGGGFLTILFFRCPLARLARRFRPGHRSRRAGRTAACRRVYMDNFDPQWSFSPCWSRLPIVLADLCIY